MKMFKVFVIAATIISATSCIIEEGGYIHRPTQAGRLVYLNTESRIKALTTIADLTIKLDKFILADENERLNLTARYFPYNIPSLSDGAWNLQNTHFKVFPDGKSLHELGAKWRVHSDVSYYSSYSNIAPGIIEIECTGIRSWKIIPIGTVTSSHYSSESELDIVGNTPKSVNGNSGANLNPYSFYEYTVTGEGRFTPFGYENQYENRNKKETLVIDYQIKTPYYIIPHNISDSYIYIFDRLFAKSGKCEMVVTDIEKPSVFDNIIGEIINTSMVPTLKITFNGITEIWELPM